LTAPALGGHETPASGDKRTDSVGVEQKDKNERKTRKKRKKRWFLLKISA
jgi:hypothetical protein